MLGLLAPQQCTHAREQHLEGERLDDVVVGAGLQPQHLVGGRILRCEHEHRQPVVGRAQPPQHLQPVDAGHHDVEDHQVWRTLARQR